MPFLDLVQRVSQITIATVCCVPHFNEIGSRNLVSMPFPSADRGTHAPSTQTVAVMYRLIYLHESISETSGNANGALLESISLRTVFVSLDGISLISTEWEGYFLFVSSRDTISSKVFGPSTVTLMSCKRKMSFPQLADAPITFRFP